MEHIRAYILTIAVAAITGAVIMSLTPGTSGHQRIIKMTCGLFLLVTVCVPMGEIEPMELETLDDFRDEAARIESDTQKQVEQELATVIREKVAAYIEDKAETMGAKLSVEVTLNEDMLPWEITLTGRVAPYAKSQLKAQIQEALAIPAQRQVWQS